MCQKAVHEELEHMNQASAGSPRSLWQSRATVQVPAAGGFFLCLAGAAAAASMAAEHC